MACSAHGHSHQTHAVSQEVAGQEEKKAGLETRRCVDVCAEEGVEVSQEWQEHGRVFEHASGVALAVAVVPGSSLPARYSTGTGAVDVGARLPWPASLPTLRRRQ